MDPTAERVELPEGYGTATTTMEWGAVRERLEQAPRYWLVTTRRDGRAHVVPVDGIWLDDAWWYGGSPGTLHQRNLEHDRRVAVHLEDTIAAVILEGSMERVVPPAEQELPAAEPGGGQQLLALRLAGGQPLDLDRVGPDRPRRVQRHRLPCDQQLGGQRPAQLGQGEAQVGPVASGRSLQSSPAGPSVTAPCPSPPDRRAAPSPWPMPDRPAGVRPRPARSSRAHGREALAPSSPAPTPPARPRPRSTTAGPGRPPRARSSTSRPAARPATGSPRRPPRWSPTASPTRPPCSRSSSLADPLA
jgi:Pyridoxamine 5'-phosphate oxidase